MFAGEACPDFIQYQNTFDCHFSPHTHAIFYLGKKTTVFLVEHTYLEWTGVASGLVEIIPDKLQATLRLLTKHGMPRIFNDNQFSVGEITLMDFLLVYSDDSIALTCHQQYFSIEFLCSLHQVQLQIAIIIHGTP